MASAKELIDGEEETPQMVVTSGGVYITKALTAIFEYRTILGRELHTKMLDQRDRHAPWSLKKYTDSMHYPPSN